MFLASVLFSLSLSTFERLKSHLHDSVDAFIDFVVKILFSFNCIVKFLTFVSMQSFLALNCSKDEL